MAGGARELTQAGEETESQEKEEAKEGGVPHGGACA